MANTITNTSDKRLLLLHPEDNIFVCCANFAAGEIVQLEGVSIKLISDIELGHKLARRNIASGEKIIKYGVSIGSATRAIQRAEHIHLHNAKSDYLPAHSRDGIEADPVKLEGEPQ